MIKNISNLGAVLNKLEQQSVKGGYSCNTCYANNGGAYNNLDPACQGCDIPEQL